MKGFVYPISFTANFIKIYQEIKKLYAFVVSIISFMEAAIFGCLYKNETNKI